MARRRLIAAVLLLIVLGTAGFAVGRLMLSGGGGTEAEQPKLLDVIEERQQTEQKEPRFTGELLGIFLAPSLDQMPPAVQEEHRRLTAGGCANIPLEQAQSLDFPQPLEMPPGYTLKEGMPQATACSGKPSGVRYEYDVLGANNIPAHLTVGRGVSKIATPQSPASRITTTVIGGREAILIRPFTPDGLAQTSEVIFPEPFGMTDIYAFNLSEAALLEVAEAVAKASQ